MQLMGCWLETHGVKQSHNNHDYPFVSSFISHGVWFYTSKFIFMSLGTMENMVICQGLGCADMQNAFPSFCNPTVVCVIPINF